jgi:hypothetical protein
MESIEACVHVPWSLQASSSRLAVVQKTNNVQNSDGLMDGVSEQNSKITLLHKYGTWHGYLTAKRTSKLCGCACAFGADNLNLSIFIGYAR